MAFPVECDTVVSHRQNESPQTNMLLSLGISSTYVRNKEIQMPLHSLRFTLLTLLLGAALGIDVVDHLSDYSKLLQHAAKSRRTAGSGKDRTTDDGTDRRDTAVRRRRPLVPEDDSSDTETAQPTLRLKAAKPLFDIGTGLAGRRTADQGGEIDDTDGRRRRPLVMPDDDFSKKPTKPLFDRKSDTTDDRRRRPLVPEDDSSDAETAKPHSAGRSFGALKDAGRGVEKELRRIREALEFSGISRGPTPAPVTSLPPNVPLEPLSEADLDLEQIYFKEWKAAQEKAESVVYTGFDCPAAGKCTLLLNTSSSSSRKPSAK